MDESIKHSDTNNSTAFRPNDAENAFFKGEGKRREIETREPLPLRWPKTREEQQKTLEAWQDVAMQVIHDAGARFRLITTFWRLIIWKEGAVFASDGMIAKAAGDCSKDTIKNDVKQYKQLGIVHATVGWRTTKAGRLVKSRVMRPAVPSDLRESVTLPFDDDLRIDGVPHDGDQH